MDKVKNKKHKRIKKGEINMVEVLVVRKPYSTSRKSLEDIKSRAFEKKKKYGTNIPDGRIANENFKDLEQIVYSTIKK